MRVAIVNSICNRYDAISDCVRGTQNAIAELTGNVPIIYCASCEYKNLKHRIVTSALDLIADTDFMRSDVVIYHFGVYYGLFDSIFLRFPAKKVVYYHNITPKQFLPASSHALVDKSLRQKINLSAADAVWPASVFSRDELMVAGYDLAKLHVMPLFLKFSAGAGVSGKQLKKGKDRRGANLLYVGRFVESKGVVDLIQAVAAIRDCAVGPFKLTLAGNLMYSDQGYIARLRAMIVANGLRDTVIFEGEVSDERLAKLYASADIFVLPSYHEGFCVPLIEALNAGCVPVTYDSGNLANLVSEWGVTTSTGDVSAYTSALGSMLAHFQDGRPDTLQINSASPITWSAYRAGVDNYLAEYTFEAFKRRIGERLSELVIDNDRSEKSR